MTKSLSDSIVRWGGKPDMTDPSLTRESDLGEVRLPGRECQGRRGGGCLKLDGLGQNGVDDLTGDGLDMGY